MASGNQPRRRQISVVSADWFMAFLLGITAFPCAARGLVDFRLPILCHPQTSHLHNVCCASIERVKIFSLGKGRIFTPPLTQPSTEIIDGQVLVEA